MDGFGARERGVSLAGPAEEKIGQPNTPVTFTLTNAGTPSDTDPTLHPDDATAYLNSDIYRLSVSVEGEGWSAKVLNALAAVEAGGSQSVRVHISKEEGAAESATVTLQATSEGDPSKTAAATIRLSR